MDENKPKREIKVNLPLLIAIILLIILGAIFGLNMFFNNNAHQIVVKPSGEIINGEISNNEDVENNTEIIGDEENINTDINEVVSGDIIEESGSGDNITSQMSGFDLTFLKLENEKKNIIYSPLSIKYALNMLADGANGGTKEQITNVIGNRKLTKYNSNNNMSLANALFIKNTFKEDVKESYTNDLKEKYNAEVIFDSFETPDNVNSWISEKTLNLINNLLDDVSDNVFLLVNALGIDMEWKQKFLTFWKGAYFEYKHEDFWISYPVQVTSNEFNSGEQIVSGMEIAAVVNNYDIVKELGEENIKKIVADEYREYLKMGNNILEEFGDKVLTEEEIENEIIRYLEEGSYGQGYIAELNSNYKENSTSTDFMMYVDDDVKVFAKDLKEYEGTTLQYVGIMPITETLDKYVETLEDNDINYIINNLKEIKSENFKEGVVTKITGFIPKFKFEYELNFKKDLNELGINNVFEQENADLTQISEVDGVFISDARHRANIEFTQDGIKAAAVTFLGGGGGGDPFDYKFEVPVEEIDLTFDKPYMFLIRDKETGEVWFVGNVYEPLSWEDEPEKESEWL
ncbi:MAG: hypothetical protein J6C46_04345 [Clostridia bacterium]|nr:hypothetical protein [Clostridia bacterium]